MKIYTKEFRLQAVNLSEQLGSSSEAAKQLGVSDASIQAWKKKYSGQPITATRKPEVKAEDLVKENQRLLHENAQLKKVNHILKSAAAFFSQDHLK